MQATATTTTTTTNSYAPREFVRLISALRKTGKVGLERQKLSSFRVLESRNFKNVFAGIFSQESMARINKLFFLLLDIDSNQDSTFRNGVFSLT